MSEKKSNYLMIGMACIALALIIGAQCGCGGNRVTPTTQGEGNTVETISKQVANNPYPWMWSCLGIVLLFLAYSYFSKKYIGWGRT